MRKLYLAVILPVTIFMILPSGISAQDSGDKLAENQIITAVNLYDDGRFEEARSVLQKVLDMSPKNDAAHFYMGLTQFCLNDIEKSEAELKKAVSLDSTNFWYRFRLAMVYSAAGKEELTLSMFEDLIRDFPKKYDLYYSMVELYQRQGRQEKALETIDQIETVFGVLHRLLRRLQRPGIDRFPEGETDGLPRIFQLQIAVDAEVDDVPRDGQTDQRFKIIRIQLLLFQKFPEELLRKTGGLVLLTAVGIALPCDLGCVGVNPARHQRRGKMKVEFRKFGKHFPDNFQTGLLIVRQKIGQRDDVPDQTLNAGEIGFHSASPQSGRRPKSRIICKSAGTPRPGVTR